MPPFALFPRVSSLSIVLSLAAAAASGLSPSQALAQEAPPAGAKAPKRRAKPKADAPSPPAPEAKSEEKSEPPTRVLSVQEPTAPTPTEAAPAGPDSADGQAAGQSGEGARSSGWLFDGSLGMPILKSDETSLAFDVNAGWQGRSWGFGAYASSYTYALSQDGTINQTVKMRFGLEARYLSGEASDPVRYELKAEANSGAFNTTYLAVPNQSGGGGGGFSTENSTINRLTAVVGRRTRVSETLRHKIELGVGLQTDTYFRSADGNTGASAGGSAGASNGGDTSFSAASSARFVGRAQLMHQTLPGTLQMRGQLEASTYQIRRVAFFAGGSQSEPGGLDVTEFRETDVGARVFGDVEALAFAGLMPAAFAGLDYIAVGGGDRSTSAVVPVFGVGLVNAVAKD